MQAKLRLVALFLGAFWTVGSAAPLVAQPMRELTFIVANNLYASPAFVAVENGYWTEQGLDVKLRLVGTGRQVAQGMQAGEAQLGHAALGTSTAAARASGNLIKGVMLYCNAAEYVGWAGGRAIVGRKDRGIDPSNLRSLEGKKIAQVTGSTSEVYLRAWAKRHGVDLSKSQIVNIPVDNMPISITQGLVDVTAPWEPYTSQSVRELGANAVILSRAEPGLVTDAIGVVANEEWIKRNAALLEKFVTGLAQAAQFIRHNPQGAATIATRYLDGLNLADATEGLNYLRWDPRMSVCASEGMLKTGNDMIAAGLIKMARPFQASDLYDDAVLRRVAEQRPDLFADLPALPQSLAQCKGKLE